MDAAFAVFDVLDKGAKALGNQEEEISNIKNSLNNSRSIASRAKDSFFIYPVLFTPGATNPDFSFTVTKFLELQYALFTVMSIGLNPKIKGDSIGEYLSNFAGESVSPIELSIENLDKFTQDAIWNEALYKDNLFKPYKFTQDNFGQEATEKEILERFKERYGPNNTIGNMQVNDYSIRDISDREKKEINDILDAEEKDNARRKTLSDIENDNLKDPSEVKYNAVQMGMIEKKLQKANPTIFKVGMYLNDVKDQIDVNLAIKANPHFISEEEAISLFDSAIEKKRALNRIIKLTTGEVKFFKDFIFHMDRVKRDSDLYARFGSHPWYQQFMKRKGMNAAMRVVNAVVGAIPGLRALVSGSNKFLPTATIVVSVTELEHATKMKYGFLLKNEKTLKDIMNALMLLGIVVYDEAAGMCTLWFNGFKEKMVVGLKEMVTSDKDSNAELLKLMNNMLRRGMI